MNIVKTLMGIIFPLISFPYASRVMGTVGIGQVNYATSICSYFVLLATLGIPTYAIREGGAIRGDKEKLGKFCTEMFILNCLSTLLSLCLFATVLFIPKFRDYRILLLIASATIPCNTLGVNWLYQILEEYARTTTQAIIFQFLALVLLLTTVKGPEDIIQYCIVSVFAETGSNLVFFITSRRYVKMFGYKNYEFKKHLKPIFVIFGMSIASTIYLNIDTSMLGYMKGDNDTGIYTAAMKISKIVCMLVSSLSSVILARLSFYMNNQEKGKFDDLVKKTADFILCFSIPCAVGLAILSRPLILLLSGAAFLPGVKTMQILSLRVILSPINGFIAYQIFMPFKKEKYSLYATIGGCILDVILNVTLIPIFSYAGAATATILAESCVFAICVIVGRKLVDFAKMFGNMLQYLIASIPILIWGKSIIQFVSNDIIYMAIVVVLSALSYFSILYFLKNDFVRFGVHEAGSMLQKFTTKRKR